MPSTRATSRATSGAIVIAGGGTGGHIYPALAIADALVARGLPAEQIHFVGSKRGMEGRLVADAGYDITLLAGRGIARRLTVDNIGAVLGLLAAVVRALWLLTRRRPAAVVSVGGYAAAPCALAAVALRIPLVVAESNAVPGAVHRLVGRFAKVNAVALPGTALPQAVVTGTPVQPRIVGVARTEPARQAARVALGIPSDRLLVAAFGGSLGSRTINTSIGELAKRWQHRGDIAIYHVVGRRAWDDFRPAAPAAAARESSDQATAARESSDGGLVYRVVEYEQAMDRLYTAADVVVCRSGSTTVAELAAVGLPAVLVPLPGSPGDHQTANARTLEDVGAAVLVPDTSCDSARLDAVLTPILCDPIRRAAMAATAHSLAVPDAANRIAELIEQVTS